VSGPLTCAESLCGELLSLLIAGGERHRHNTGRTTRVVAGMTAPQQRGGRPRMKSKAAKLLLVLWVVGAFAQVALAGIFSPFSFSFANSFMNSLFLFPFRMGGCF
jgi:hypothetical protein